MGGGVRQRVGGGSDAGMNALPAGAPAWVGKARCEPQPPLPASSSFSRDLGAQLSSPQGIGHSVRSSLLLPPLLLSPAQPTPLCCLLGSAEEREDRKQGAPVVGGSRQES